MQPDVAEIDGLMNTRHVVEEQTDAIGCVIFLCLDRLGSMKRMSGYAPAKSGISRSAMAIVNLQPRRSAKRVA